MEKIVVMTGESERDDNLIKCLEVLFPECEIEIHSRLSGDNDKSASSNGVGDKNPDQALNKLMSFL